VKAGSSEVVYVNMPAFGLAGALEPVPMDAVRQQRPAACGLPPGRANQSQG